MSKSLEELGRINLETLRQLMENAELIDFMKRVASGESVTVSPEVGRWLFSAALTVIHGYNRVTCIWCGEANEGAKAIREHSTTCTASPAVQQLSACDAELAEARELLARAQQEIEDTVRTCETDRGLTDRISAFLEGK